MEFVRKISINIGQPESYFIFGPRGTGKTSLIKNLTQNYPHKIWIDL